MNKNSMNKTPIFALKLATFVIALGYSLIIPVMPFYMKNLGAGGKELGWLTAIYALTQTLCAPFWGVLSDRIGRKPIISIGMLGYTISLLLFGLASSFWTLFIARALSGILSSATSVASLAYVGDSSTEDERSKNMGQLGAAMSVGVMLGPLFGGILAGYSLETLDEFLDFSKENSLDKECYCAAFLCAYGYGIQIGGYEDDLTHTLTEFFHTQGMEYPEISEIVCKEKIYTDCSDYDNFKKSMTAINQELDTHGIRLVVLEDFV